MTDNYTSAFNNDEDRDDENDDDGTQMHLV